jgi:Flp pilus assembly protein CpaB
MVIGFAVLIGFLVIALLNGTIRPTGVVAAKVGLAPGTLLTADLLEVRSIPAGDIPTDAFKAIEDVEGQMLTVGRAPGDLITQAVVRESAVSGIPSQLEPGHVAMAVRVYLASGVAGLVREGQTVSALLKGIFSSCANPFLFQTKDVADRDMILPHLRKSEKGMVNTDTIATWCVFRTHMPSPSQATAWMCSIWSQC